MNAYVKIKDLMERAEKMFALKSGSDKKQFVMDYMKMAVIQQYGLTHWENHYKDEVNLILETMIFVSKNGVEVNKIGKKCFGCFYLKK